VDRAIHRALHEGVDCSVDFRAIWPDGTVRWMTDKGRLYCDKEGRPLRMIGVVADITDRKQAEVERQRLTEELGQAQKLEALGRLAGGVAHDFNNLLTAIMGQTDLLLSMEGRLGLSEAVVSGMKQVQSAAERAAELTRRLLSFSRKRSVKVEVLDPKRVIIEMEQILRRLIGEDIDLVVRLDSTAPCVRMAEGQIEQLVMNLALNARDAMSSGGRLLIETSEMYADGCYVEAHPGAVLGRHVVIAVSDTGEGMGPQTLSRLFEPFFTTKPVGEGTGLGLSMIYGMVKQVGGHVTVQSEVGRGSMFRVYVPAVEEKEVVRRGLSGGGTVGLSGDEVVLVCEDDGMVRSMTCQALRANGYRVMEAASGSEALELAAGHDGPIDLLLTDVVMPQMDGRELVDRLQLMRPTIRVVFMSGYFSGSLDLQGGGGWDLIEKPFTPVILLGRVRKVLDQRKGEAVG
jgi:signal transduction histidine kinase